VFHIHIFFTSGVDVCSPDALQPLYVCSPDALQPLYVCSPDAIYPLYICSPDALQPRCVCSPDALQSLYVCSQMLFIHFMYAPQMLFSHFTLEEKSSATYLTRRWLNTGSSLVNLQRFSYRESYSWDITRCSSLKVNRRFGRKYRLHLQGGRISQVWNYTILYPRT
jgi:hypothetical protein